MPSEAAGAPQKKSACARCRQRKVRCDGLLPACSNCLKARVPCEESTSSDKRYIQQLETRIHWLESLINSDPLSRSGDATTSLEPQPSPALPPPRTGAEGHAALPAPVVPTTSSESQTSSGPASVQPFHAEQLQSTSPQRAASEHLGPCPTPASQAQTQSTHTPRIGPEQPLAHEVGLLSLSAANAPKYLGPSSGVSFARLIFAAVPQTQGLPASLSSDFPATAAADVPCASLPLPPEVHRFVAAYFDAFDHLYPFLSEAQVDGIVDRCAIQDQGLRVTNADIGLLFLVVAIGSRTLETQLGADFASATYLAAALKHVADVQLHENLQGVQIMLLLVLSSLCFPSGLNAWFLTHTIIASCIDLGLQRKQPRAVDISGPGGDDMPAHDVRSAMFWSAYSLERTLATVLGRPLTLRDEAIDIEFPGEQGSDEVDVDAIDAASLHVSQTETSSPGHAYQHQEGQPAKRPRMQTLSESPVYTAANLSFRFDRIIAEIKLMVYRVAQSPRRFPWPTNFEVWQQQVYSSCKGVLERARSTFSGRHGSRNRSYHILPSLELKHHQCIMLLFRPSPAIPRPTSDSLSICFDSATEMIRIHYELHRFGQMMNSWLTAHTTFVSGITMLYCLLVSPVIRDRTRDAFNEHVRRCSETLEALGKTWSVAKDARTKFDRLAEVTKDSWRRRDAAANTNESRSVLRDSHAESQQMLVAEDSSAALPRETDWMEPNLSALYDTTGIFSDQLGDISGWFDLEWFETFGTEGLGNAGSSIV